MRPVRAALPAVSLLVASLLAATARAGEAPDLRRLFPHERDVFIERDGLTRVPVPPDVLAACRPDLSDLRIFDRDERELAYLIDAGVPEGRRVEMVRTHAVEIVDARREEIRREDGPPLYRETYVVAAPPATDAAWELVFEVSRPRFVRRLEVRANGAPEPVVAGGSIFRLPELPAEKVRVALPTAGPLTVTLEGEDGGYLEPRLRFEATSTVASKRERVIVPLEEVARRSLNGRTEIELVRPRGVVPDVLRIETATGSFNRTVEVWDEGPGRSPVRLGGAKLFRVQTDIPVEARELDLQPARGERLRVQVDDGDSGPLEGLTVVAVVRQPVLVVTLSGAGDQPAGRLRYGGGRAHAPRYDLTGLLPRPSTQLTGERAVAAARLYDPSQVGVARLGEARANPAYDRSPALAFAMRPGAAIDSRAWTHRRPIAVRPSPDGLTRLRLGAADLARARPDLADVRVVDAESRQWPYLVGREAAHVRADLEVTGPTRRRGASVYGLRLPVTPIVVAMLGLETDVPFFDRAASVIGRRADGTEVTLAAGRLVRHAEERGAVRVGLRPERVESLEIAIEDGNDAPLAFHAVRAEMPERELYLAAPAGEYALLVGNADATAPSYELERVRDVILAVSSGTAEPAVLAANPAYSVRARLASEERLDGTVSGIVLWIVLIGAVVVLTVVTLRLARREEPGGGKSTTG
jgi:hypothetical protein